MEREQATQRIRLIGERWGITDKGLLQQLVALDLNEESVVALLLLPLAEVAWADGAVDGSERAAILRAAAAAGLEGDTQAYKQLEAWLERRPAALVFEVASAFLQQACANVGEELGADVRRELLKRAGAVASASSPVPGGAKVSASEAKALKRIESAL